MKRKFIYPLALLAALYHPALAQTQKQVQPSRWSLTLAGGLAIPTRSFAHFNTPVGSGTVLPGAGIELSTAYRLSRRWSAVLALGGQQNRGDGIPFLESGAQAKTDYTNRYWRMARIQAGPAFTIPITHNHRLSIQLHALAGVQKTWPPEADVINPGGLITYPGPLRISHAGILPGVKLPWAFSWETDAGFEWTLNKRFALVATGGYRDSRPSRTFVYVEGINSVTGQPVILYSTKASFSTATIHANIGLTYFFPYSKKISVAP